jgi:ABC-type phosphate/phosphonate transport system substrate-binding protein
MNNTFRIILRRKYAGLLFCFFGFILFGKIQSAGQTRINDKIDLQAKDTTPVFKLAYSLSVFRNVNVNDAKAAAKILIQEIIKQVKINYKSEAVVIEDPIQDPNIINKEDVNIINMTSYEYLAIQKKIKLYPFAIPVLNDSCLNKVIVLIRKDSNINSIADLKNKKIKIQATSSMSKTSILDVWAKVLFYNNNVNLNIAFTTQETMHESASKAITSIFFKKADAAVVVEDDYKTIIELNPQLGKEMKVIAISKPLLLSISCYTEKEKNVEKSIRDLMISTTFNLNKNQTGQNFLNIFKMRMLIPFKIDYLRNVTELYNEYESIAKKNKNLR